MHDFLPHVIFYVFAALTVISSVLMICQSNPVRSVLFLVLAFFTSAILWILVSAEFLALILVLVYVGAVMTLFLFVVMMLNIDIEAMKKHHLRYYVIGLAMVALLVSLLMKAIPNGTFKDQRTSAGYTQMMNSDHQLSDTEALGMVLYTDYAFAFELAAAILLVAIIAAITMVHRDPFRSKRQNIRQQIMTRREERVKLVKMNTERT